MTHNDVASAVIGITAKRLTTATCFQSLVFMTSGRLLEPHKILALAFVDNCDTFMKSWPVIDLTTETFRDFHERLASKSVTTLFPHTAISATSDIARLSSVSGGRGDVQPHKADSTHLITVDFPFPLPPYRITNLDVSMGSVIAFSMHHISARSSTSNMNSDFMNSYTPCRDHWVGITVDFSGIRHKPATSSDTTTSSWTTRAALVKISVSPFVLELKVEHGDVDAAGYVGDLAGVDFYELKIRRCRN